MLIFYYILTALAVLVFGFVAFVATRPSRLHPDPLRRH